MEIQDIIIKLALATFLGGVIGLEREFHNQPAGLRTHIIVCLGATLIMMVSIAMMDINKFADPGRIAAQVVTGIGFLGAGAILRFGTSVRGLTTAACLWTVAAIGLAIGAGFYLPAAIVTLIVFGTVFIFDKLEKTLVVGRTYKRLVITVKDAPGIIGQIEKICANYGLSIRNFGINKSITGNKIQLSALIKVPDGLDFDQFSREFMALDGLEQFEMD